MDCVLAFGVGGSGFGVNRIRAGKMRKVEGRRAMGVRAMVDFSVFDEVSSRLKSLTDRARDFERGGERAVEEVTGEVVGEVVAVKLICQSGDLLQISVTAAEVSRAHVAAGQFVRLRRMNEKRGRLMIMASAPGRDVLEFIVNVKNDRENLRNLQTGDELLLSSVMGEGLDLERTVQGPRILLFVDSAQVRWKHCERGES